LIVLLVAVGLRRRTRRRGSAFQAGIVGAMYEWQNRDKQQALQIIVNEKQTRRPSEHPDEPPKSGTKDPD
jgi:hypothetical protein